MRFRRCRALNARSIQPADVGTMHSYASTTRCNSDGKFCCFTSSCVHFRSTVNTELHTLCIIFFCNLVNASIKHAYSCYCYYYYYYYCYCSSLVLPLQFFHQCHHMVVIYGVVSGTSEACVWVTPTWLQRGCALNTIQYCSEMIYFISNGANH